MAKLRETAHTKKVLLKWLKKRRKYILWFKNTL